MRVVRAARLVAFAGGLALLAAGVRAERVLLTVDDLPLVNAPYFTHEEQARQIRAVLDAIEKHGARGVFFAIGERIRPHDAPLLDELVRRGHTIGNHTYSHLSASEAPVEVFEADVLRNDEELARWMSGPRYFRYPYLEMGPTRRVRDELTRFLAGHGYRPMAVTIDSEDFDYNVEYTRAVKRNDLDLAAAVARRYQDHVVKAAVAARADARAKLGRDIPHILLLHMSLLNADALDPLLSALVARGFSFGTAEETLADPVYALEDDYFGPQGLTWLDRILR